MAFGNKVNINTKCTSPPFVSNNCAASDRVPAKIVGGKMWKGCQSSICHLKTTRAHAGSLPDGSVLPSGLLFSSTASFESIGSSALTRPEVITMRPFASSWLSAMIVPSEKYFVSLFMISCSKTSKQTLLKVRHAANKFSRKIGIFLISDLRSKQCPDLANCSHTSQEGDLDRM